MAEKFRIDKILYDLGLAESRTKAQAMVMAGVVLVNEKRVEKPSETFSADVTVRIKGVSEESKFVGRGGLKLEKALDEFKIDPSGFRCLDIGSSTGGFTDCLLRHGAASVVALDVGTNQLDWRLRSDPRVEVRENTNARFLKPEDFSHPFDLVVMDVSFISVRMIFPVIPPLLTNDGRLIVLIKPQFEVGRNEVEKHGVIRSDEKHERVKREITNAAEQAGLIPKGLIDSPIRGAEGNKEFLALYEKGKPENQ